MPEPFEGILPRTLPSIPITLANLLDANQVFSVCSYDLDYRL